MEIYLTRTEIRRRAHARLGFVLNSSQAPLVYDQHNEFIRAAALEVAQQCPWVNTKQEFFPNIGIDQRFVTYPAGCTAASVIQIGVWDASADRYCLLRRGMIPVSLDDEPLVAEGEPASIQGRGIPLLYELGDQIELWPRADQAYALKVDYALNQDLGAEDTISIVDAEAIILLTCAEIYAFQQDVDQARYFRAKFDDRIKKLAQGQRHDLTMTRKGSYLRRVQGRSNNPLGDWDPNSGSWPSVTPA